MDAGAGNGRTADTRWFVLQTRSRQEKRLAEALARQAIRHYLPLIPVIRTYAKRKAAFDLPLFPGYVFMEGGEEQRVVALQTNRVVNVIPVPDRGAFEREITAIRQAVESGEAVQLFPRLVEGARCRVVAGPLAGLEGAVERIGQRCNVYLSVSVLGQSALIEVDGSQVVPLD